MSIKKSPGLLIVCRLVSFRPTRPTSCSTSDKTRSENPLCPPPTRAPPPPPSPPTTSPPAKMRTQSWAPPPTSPWKRTEGTLEVQFDSMVICFLVRTNGPFLLFSFCSHFSNNTWTLIFFFFWLHPPQLLFSPLNAAVCWWKCFSAGWKTWTLRLSSHQRLKNKFRSNPAVTCWQESDQSQLPLLLFCSPVGGALLHVLLRPF